jgi:hypothetical protein
MSVEPIYCFNGNECCYNLEASCLFYQGGKDDGSCIVDALKGGTPTPVAQTQTTLSGTPKLEVGKYIDIEVPIVDSPSMNKGNRKDGTEWMRTNFTVNLDGQELRVTLWDDLAEEGMKYGVGQFIKFKGIRVDQYKDELQLSSAKYTEIGQ